MLGVVCHGGGVGRSVRAERGGVRESWGAEGECLSLYSKGMDNEGAGVCK